MKLTHTQFADCTPHSTMPSHWFTTFASDLGLRPGQWPTKLEPETGIGNGMNFYPAKVTPDFVTYAQEFGSLRIRVYND